MTPKKRSKTRLASIKSLEKKVDRLYQEKMIALHPYSCVSGKPTEVIHHVIYKSQSNYLRYDPCNGVPLTNLEHFYHHNRGDAIILNAIISHYGQAWFDNLQKRRHEICKTNKGYLLAKIEEMELW
jgi:hypothetical protein